jgi:hypothetical protein
MNNEFTHNTKEKYTIVTKKYNNVYLITLTRSTTIKVVVDGKTAKCPRKKPKTWAFCMLIDDFERKMAENKDMSWVFHIDKLKYHNVGQEYYDQYKSGKWNADDKSKETFSEVLERGDEHLIVQGRPGIDWFLRDVTGEIIVRNMIFDYMQSGIMSGPGDYDHDYDYYYDYDYDYHYDIPRLKNYLDKHPQVIDVVVIDIPYYNAGFDGQEGIEFVFVPKNDEEFQMLADMNDSFNRDAKIKGMLEIDKFRIEQKGK